MLEIKIGLMDLFANRGLGWFFPDLGLCKIMAIAFHSLILQNLILIIFLILIHGQILGLFLVVQIGQIHEN
jgi:hypothetical protein